ncbi:hypothetical protein BD309DRAFT_213129 [Dichomitus squalens]|uniref:Uncharacterized protein n=1 Tax=Dichomitus squalens TaxID=114155 RepID=A0A4Q9NRW5_9APHY|nr:hypothetical protein BD309DRAFT_213129 [Dichomitus squalens]TBU55206.1 hypothetical protein BD310DRAFT_950929 [Dichomitus squalens]
MRFMVARDSSLPAPSPLPLSENVESSKPEIGGSYGGFIALVVSLACIFVFSCIGIFILLRSHEPTPYERQMRRSRARTRAEWTYEAPVGPPGIRERLAQLFGRRQGWIKASGGDGDEWDASDHTAPYYSASELRERDRAESQYPISASNATSTVGNPRNSVVPGARADSVEVELRAPSPESLLSNAFQHDLQPSEESDRGRITPIPQVHTSSSPTPLSPVSSLSEHTHEGLEDGFERRDDRHFSVQSLSQDTGSISVRSMRKFDNGTKFREALTF